MTGVDICIINLWAYVAGTALVILLPGPNSLFVLSVATRKGRSAGWRSTLGVLLGDAVLMLAAIIGVSAFLQAYPWLIDIIRYAGGAYLVYLGAAMFVSAVRSLRATPTASIRSPTHPEAVEGRSHFLKAVSISLLNPKAILFWMGFFVQFVEPTCQCKVVSFAMLGLVAEAMSLAYLATLIFVGSAIAAAVSQYRPLGPTLGAGAGALLMGFGVKLIA